MKKRWSKFMVLAMSLLLLVGMVASASAANGVNNSPAGCLSQGIKAGQQHAQTALKVVSDLTGLSAVDIHSQRIEGQSLAAIAETKGVSEQAVIDKVIAERTAALDQLKADNKITETQYQNCLNNMQDKVKANIERTTVGGNGMGRKQGTGQGQGMGRRAGCQNMANCPYAAPANSK